MKYEILGQEAFPLLKISLSAGECIKAESNAMVSFQGGIKLHGKMDGGIGKAVARLFSGESLFLQQFKAEETSGEVMLATFMPGTLHVISLKGETIQVQSGSFMAATENIDISTKVQSISKGLFGGEGFFASKISGVGEVFLSSFGGIYEISLKEGEEIVIDNGHLVAWDNHLNYNITKGASSWFSALTSGEVLALKFQGPGRIWIQSRNVKDFKNWILSFVPKPSRQN